MAAKPYIKYIEDETEKAQKITSVQRAVKDCKKCGTITLSDLNNARDELMDIQDMVSELDLILKNPVILDTIRMKFKAKKA